MNAHHKRVTQYESWGVIGLFLLAILLTGLSTRFLNFEVQGILLSKPETIQENLLYRSFFYMHIIPGMLSLVLGPWQFSSVLRKRYLPLHRIIGKLYVGAVLISGLSGLVIAFFAAGGMVSTMGFLLLAIFWLTFTFQAMQSLRQRRINRHRVWMIRSYAMTFAAVTLRLGLLLSQFGIVTFDVIYPIMAWASWIINIAAVEYFLKYKNYKPIHPTL